MIVRQANSTPSVEGPTKRLFYSEISPLADSQILLVENIKAIIQSIKLLMSTPIGVRFFNPEFGTNLDEMLFELMDERSVESFKTNLIESIERWEPRIKLDTTKTEVSPNYDTHVLGVKLVFNIVGSSGKYEYNMEVTE